MGRTRGPMGRQLPGYARRPSRPGADRTGRNRRDAAGYATGRAGGHGDDLRRFRAHRAGRYDPLATPPFFRVLQRQRRAGFDDRRTLDGRHGGPMHALADLARGYGDRDPHGRLDATGTRSAGGVSRGYPGVGHLGEYLRRTDHARARTRLAWERHRIGGRASAPNLRLAGGPFVDRQGDPDHRYRPTASRQNPDRWFLGTRP